jgi:sec-independent protein translocase protein TatB
MFDIGGWEFLLIAVLAIVVIGPKDLPGTIRTVTGWIRRARTLASEFQSGLDDIAREADIDSVKDDLQSGLGLDDITDAKNSIRDNLEQSIDPGGDIRSTFHDEGESVGNDDPFLKDYFDENEDEDDELDDIDPKYKIAEKSIADHPDDGDEKPKTDGPAEDEPESAETVKKA